MTKRTRDLVLMLIIGTLIGAAATNLWGNRTRSAGDVTDGTTPDVLEETGAKLATTTTISPALAFPLPPSIPLNTRVGLSVPDQPAGKTVTVSNVSVVGTKWIAIYEDTDGHPGWILGATRVHEGDTTATVSLLRAEGSVAGRTYYAAILNDDGDAEFNRLTDLPPLSPDKVTIVLWRAQ